MNEQMDFPNTFDEFAKHHQIVDKDEHYSNGIEYIPVFRVKQWLEHQMTVKEYRQRMIQAFHNADHDELIAVCVLPSEKEFEHLEWLLKNHYKKEPCDDVISRQAVIDGINRYFHDEYYQRTSIQDCRDCLIEDVIKKLPPVTPQPKTGRWIYGEDNFGTGRDGWYCNQCGHFEFWDYSSDMKSAELNLPNLCPNCKAKMQEVVEE